VKKRRKFSQKNVFYVKKRRYPNTDIDDLFLIAKNIFLKSTIESLRTSFRNLTLNLECGPKVVFLDLNVEIDPLTKMLDFTLYTLPTNTFSFLLTSSNHPNHIFKNIPKSLFIRIRRNNTRLSNYLNFS
jgi:hypothetical protein